MQNCGFEWPLLIPLLQGVSGLVRSCTSGYICNWPVTSYNAAMINHNYPLTATYSRHNRCADWLSPAYMTNYRDRAIIEENARSIMLVNCYPSLNRGITSRPDVCRLRLLWAVNSGYFNPCRSVVSWGLCNVWAYCICENTIARDLVTR